MMDKDATVKTKVTIIVAALLKCFMVVGRIEGVGGSKHQVSLPARELVVKSNAE